MAPRRNRQGLGTNAGAEEITGPRSALTSFLREQGITSAPNYGRRPTTQVGDENEAPVASTSTESVDVSLILEAPESSTTSGEKKRKQGYTTAAIAAKKKKAAGKDSEDDDDVFTIAGKPEGPKKSRYDNRTPGMISPCAECGKRFTVTKYTPSNPHGPGVLCPNCMNESIDDIASKKPPKAKVVKKRATRSVEERQARPIPTLQQSCISVIGVHINNVEALGNIGAENRDRIAKIVCKHRALTTDNLGLFLAADHTELSLYDCTNISDTDLASISAFCPRLETLKLFMCGRLDDDVLNTWGAGFRDLKYFNLYAPYLVTSGAWKKFLDITGERGGQLKGFGIKQSARFDHECIHSLVKNNPQLHSLQLSQLGKLCDVSLALLSPLKHLTSLDISGAGTPQGTALTDEAVVALLENAGEWLVELNLDQNYELTDRVLVEGVKIHCPRLRTLSLKSLGLIQSAGLEALFTDWVCPGLSKLNLHRCILLENEAIEAVLNHSGHSLVYLDLHSVDEIEDKVLYQLAKTCPEIQLLDVSFVRAMDDYVIRAMLDEMPSLKTLFVHGNNRVTDLCPQKRGVSIRGQENCLHVEL